MPIREWAQLQQRLLKAQMRVLRDLVGTDPAELEHDKGQTSKRKSKISIVEDILIESQHPLHINQIIQLAAERFNLTLDRDSLVSALTKKIRKGDTFIRTGRNTFGLVGQ